MGLFGAVVNFALSGNQALAVVFLVRVIGAGPFAAGLLLAVPGVSGLIAAVTTRRLTRRVGTARGLLLCVLATSPFGLLIPLAQPGRGLAFYVAGTLIVAAGTATASIIIASFGQAYSPPLMRGRVAATMSILVAGTSPLGHSPAARWPLRSAFAERCGSCSASWPRRGRFCSRTPSGVTGTCLPGRATPALRAPCPGGENGRGRPAGETGRPRSCGHGQETKSG
jgi:hypothetical protein